MSDSAPRKFRFVCISVAMIALSITHLTSQSQSLIPFESPLNPDFLVNLESVDWIHGSEDCESLLAESNYQEWQQVQYLPGSFIFRQNKCSNYEGPFVYLFLGREKGILIDTGATEKGGVPLLKLIRAITELPIIVAHSHGHGDHRLGDTAFRKQKGMSVVGVGSSSVQKYFGFSNWPNEPTTIDLGDREISLLPIPGHNDDDLAYYDSQSKIIITGDTLYPGRLYVKD